MSSAISPFRCSQSEDIDQTRASRRMSAAVQHYEPSGHTDQYGKAIERHCEVSPARAITSTDNAPPNRARASPLASTEREDQLEQ